MLLSQLTYDQKGHLVWRLDHNTCCGFLTALRVAKGRFGDLDLVDIFERFGDSSNRSAKILAGKVERFGRPKKISGKFNKCQRTS